MTLTTPEAGVTTIELGLIPAEMPRCCSNHMVLLPGKSFECARAFFDLSITGAVTVSATDGVSGLADDATDEQRELFEHLTTARVIVGTPREQY